MPSILEDLQKNKAQGSSESGRYQDPEDSELLSIAGEGVIPDENNSQIAKAPQQLFDSIFNDDEADF